MATIDEQLQSYRAAFADAEAKGDQAIALHASAAPLPS